LFAVATIEETFVLAMNFHQAGNLSQAEMYYRQVLQATSSHPGAWNGLGVVAAQQGKLADATACFQRLLQLYPDDPQARNNLGLLFSRQGKHNEAIAQFRQVLLLKPEFYEALFNLGNSCRSQGNADEAIKCYQQASRLNPERVEAQNNLGALLLAQGRVEEAVDCLRNVLRLRPDLAEACTNLGNALLRQEKFDEAIDYYRRTLQLRPQYAEGWYNLGNALKRQGKPEDAVPCFQQALRLRPNYAEACNNLGSVLTVLDKLDDGIAWYRKALAIKPEYQAAYYNWGNALGRQDKLAEAILCYHEALRLKPSDAAAWTNLGNLHQVQGQFNKALACFQKALDHEPDRAETHFNRALLRLLLGDWVQGWPEYEWRLQTDDFPRCPFPQPRWDGSPLAGRTLLVLAEQGLGDAFQFVRFVMFLRQSGEQVIFQCQPPLLPLMTQCLGEQGLITQGSPYPDFDVYTPLLTLPAVLGIMPATVPSPVPYLHASSDLVGQWRQKLSGVPCPVSGVKTGPSSDIGLRTSDFGHFSDTGHRTPDSGQFRVGIAWQGTPKFRGDRQRSIPLEQFAPLAEVPGVQFISLQKGPGSEQLSVMSCQLSEKIQTTSDRFCIHDLREGLDETSGAFMDTAAVLMSLDLVISSDTAVPHLAGALGVPVWLALALAPDWRWLLQREDTPWYPTMRLFRQTHYGHWEDVFERMAEELRRLAAHRTGMKTDKDSGDGR
jgi:tetratricopeptide (TPR) repeat protein